MADVTRILSAIEQGDSHAAEQLLPLVHNELRKLAAQKFTEESLGQPLQSTALVHEAHLRLVTPSQSPPWVQMVARRTRAREPESAILAARCPLISCLSLGGLRG